MGSDESFQEKSYRQHADHFKLYAREGENAAKAQTWFARDTVDAWRHERLYRLLDPLCAAAPHACWLTVGDGRYGRDARYIQEKGGDALATDISEYLLREAKETGYIEKYRVENAEALSFPNESFDFVFCKEAYHHFPRPTIALYEMLRVARNGVVLIEPNDLFMTEKSRVILYRKLKNSVKRLLGRKSDKHNFEESGNYVFSISRREIEKVALGLNYRTIAFQGINDAYAAGVEYEKMADNGPLQKKVKQIIKRADLLCASGLMEPFLLATIIFKNDPSPQLLQVLQGAGYEIVHLPDNPYISG